MNKWKKFIWKERSNKTKMSKRKNTEKTKPGQTSRGELRCCKPCMYIFPMPSRPPSGAMPSSKFSPTQLSGHFSVSRLMQLAEPKKRTLGLPFVSSAGPQYVTTDRPSHQRTGRVKANFDMSWECVFSVARRIFLHCFSAWKTGRNLFVPMGKSEG